MFHETFLTSTFWDDDLLNAQPDDSRSLNVHERRSTHKTRTYQVLIDIQAIHHEKPTLEAHEVTKLHQRDLTTSNDEFSSYAQLIKLIFTRATTHSVDNETLDYIVEERCCLNIFMKEDRQPRNDFRCSSSQVTKQYGVYTASPAKKNLSALIEGTRDKRLQFQVNWLNIS